MVNELDKRRLEALRFALGPVVLAALDDPDVVEVMLNDDGLLFIDSIGEMQEAGRIEPDDAMAILNQVSSALNHELGPKNPSVAGELPLKGERFQGIIPPNVAAATFSIRKKAERIYSFKDYVRTGVMSFRQAEILRTAISQRKNILLAGGTGSGKTTFCNAVLKELADLRPKTRMILMEDTYELQCTLRNRVFLKATEWMDMAQLGIIVNRMRPDSISVGEVRAGAPALVLLKNWNTGHPGGVATVHADSATEALVRIDQLIQEVSAHPQRALIAKAIDYVVYLEREESKRSVKEIVRVTGYDLHNQEFKVEQIH